MKLQWYMSAILTLVLSFHVPSMGQHSGLTIIDSVEQEPLPFARVSFLGDSTHWQGQTDKTGKISYSGPYPVKVEIAPLGYEPQKITLNEPGPFTWEIKPLDFDLDQVVLTGQFGNGSSRNSMYKVRVLNRDRIEAMGANSLKDLLGQEVNFRLAQDQVLGTQLAIQGLSGEGVKVMIDGVPVIGRLGGNIDLNQITLDDVERVEIVEGPLSVQYGTDALAGTVNLITRKDRPKKLGISARAYTESVGQYNFSGAANWARKRNAFSAGGGRNFFGGYALVDTSRSKSWKPKEQYQAHLQWTRNMARGTLTLRSQGFQELLTNRGPLREPYRETAFDELYRTLRWDNHLTWNHSLGKKWNANLLTGINLYRREKEAIVKDLTTLTSTPSGAEQQDTTVFDRAMGRYTFNRGGEKDKWTSSWGVDAAWERGKGGRIAEGGREIGDAAAFGLMRCHVSNAWKIQAGGRLTYNTAFGTAFTPSVNLWFQPSQTHTFRTSYAQGFRTPSLKELHLFFVDINHNIKGNPDLVPETAHNASLAYDGQNASQGRVLKWEASAWLNLLRNAITLTQASPAGDLFSYFNLGSSRSLGVRGGFSWIQDQWRFQVSGSYSSFANRLAESEAPLPVVWTPETSANLSYQLPFGGLEAQLFHKFNGRRIQFQSDTEGNVTESTTGSYHLFDFNMSRKFWKDQIGASLGVKNLFNVTDIPVGGSQGGVHANGTGSVPIGWGRTLFLQLLIDLQ